MASVHCQPHSGGRPSRPEWTSCRIGIPASGQLWTGDVSLSTKGNGAATNAFYGNTCAIRPNAGTQGNDADTTVAAGVTWTGMATGDPDTSRADHSTPKTSTYGTISI